MGKLIRNVHLSWVYMTSLERNKHKKKVMCRVYTSRTVNLRICNVLYTCNVLLYLFVFVF